jgi:hypothetical protein
LASPRPEEKIEDTTSLLQTSKCGENLEQKLEEVATIPSAEILPDIPAPKTIENEVYTRSKLGL